MKQTVFSLACSIDQSYELCKYQSENRKTYKTLSLTQNQLNPDICLPENDPPYFVISHR